MKNIILLFAFLSLSFAGITAAEHNTYTLLSAATGTGPGAAVTLKDGYVDTEYHIWACDLRLTGGPSAAVVRLEGNQGQDTTTFSPTGILTITCSGAELTAGICRGAAANNPVKVIRPNVVTLSDGTNPTASMYCTGVR